MGWGRNLFGLAACVFTVGISSWAGCLFPQELNLKRIDYRIESIGSSLKAAMDFPLLTDLPCSDEMISFGKLWTWELTQTEPIRVTVTDRNGAIVQETTLTGKFSLKDTPPYTSLLLSDLKQSKKLQDHSWVRLEWRGGGTFLPTPSLEVDDYYNRRRYAAQITLQSSP